jgi:hypothetical protein
MPAGGRHELRNSAMPKWLLLFSRLRFWLARARGRASLRAVKKDEEDTFVSFRVIRVLLFFRCGQNRQIEECMFYYYGTTCYYYYYYYN